MPCTKFLGIGLLLLLTACATPKPQPETVDTAAPTEAPDSATPAAPRPVTPNPYAAQPEPDDPATRALLLKANAAMAEQAWGKAEPLLLQAIAQAPEYSGIYYNLGRVYHQLNRPAEAMLQFQNAIAVNDKNIYAYNALAVLKREQGDFSGAETLYKQALNIWPDHADSHKNLGILYDLYMGRLHEALASYQAYQALQEQPDRLVTAWIVDLERRLPAPSSELETTPVEAP